MAVLGIDLGGTKLALAVFSTEGELLNKRTALIEKRKGKEVGKLIVEEINSLETHLGTNKIKSIGIAVPGISRQITGTVWAPNIPGWDDYPLFAEVKQKVPGTPLIIESDRACYISGELWKGNAQGCSNAIYMAVGTGIGAGILADGKILRGAHDIAGAIGWLALDRPYHKKYVGCGCFEYHASGDGIARVAREILEREDNYSGLLKNKHPDDITAEDVFIAYEENDEVANEVISISIEFWGMAVANLVSIFNPEKIILGGGVFGPAIKFLSAIKEEALKWGQPISMKQVTLESSKLGGDAGIFGAGFLAIQEMQNSQR